VKKKRKKERMWRNALINKHNHYAIDW
jgi:hypothetical protein